MDVSHLGNEFKLGLIQQSVLVPLVSLYFNDLPDEISQYILVMFANDTKVFFLVRMPSRKLLIGL